MRPPRPETVEVAKFRARLMPRQGRWELSKVSARAAFEYGGAAVTWDVCGEDCLPPDGTAALWTDQAQVTFVDFDGTCWSNGLQVPACGFPPPCDQQGMFCGPLQIVSNLTWGGARGAMPDPVIQLSQDTALGNEVLGCKTNAGNTWGHCGGTGKVDAPTSNLTSPIPGDATAAEPTVGCSWCYGNASAAVGEGLPGLQHAVVSGNDAVLRRVGTVHAALRLSNSNEYFVDITVRQAMPAFDPPASQLELRDGVTPATCAETGLTRISVRGGGFGPPGECLAATLTSCPLSGAPGAGYTMELVDDDGNAVAATGVSWSDGEVSGLLPPGARAGRVRISTPQAPAGVTTTQAFTQCIRVAGGPLVPAGATAGAGGAGGPSGHVEVGHSMGTTVSTGGGITMTSQTAVAP